MGAPSVAAFIVLGGTAAFLAGAPPDGNSLAGDKAVAAPDARAQADSLKLIKDVYKTDYANAKGVPARIALAKKLLAQGIGTRDDPSARYVLFTEARDLAVDAGDARTALDAIDEIARRYLAVAALEMKLQALEKLARSAKTADVQRGLAEIALDVTEAAFQVNNDGVARRSAALATSMATRAKSKHFAAWTSYRSRIVAECEKEHGPAKEALALLRESPADANANLVAGRYLALLKGDWQRGMTLLREGADPDLKDLAAKELAAPAKPDERSSLGDLWLAAAEKLQPPFKARAISRGTFWLEKSLEGLEGLSRAKCEDRLQHVLLAVADRKPGLVAELFDGEGLKRKKKVRIDPQVSFDWGSAAPDKELPADRFSIRWTGELMAANPGKYTLALRADDGIRLWLDDELLIDQWGWGGHEGRATVFLTDKPHPIRVEYFEIGGPASISLSWRRDDVVAEAIVPAAFFLHDAETERTAKK